MAPKATTAPNRAARRHPEKARRWASKLEAAEYIGVSERTLRRMIAAGQLTAYRFGPRLVRLDLDEIDAQARVIPTMDALGVGDAA